MFRKVAICKKVVSTKESLLLSEFEGVRQDTLDANKECYSERSWTDQSEEVH